jgi:drug/metabolite transporter (DMT)-like permease
MWARAGLTPSMLAGIVLLLSSTLAGTLADGTVKDLATRFEAPQVFGVSGLIMAVLCLIAARAGTRVGMFSTSCLTTKAPGLLLARSLATVVASFGFFYAIGQIPLAEVFFFIGMMPLFAALLSRVMLGEAVTLAAWVGLAVGLLGIMMMFNADLSTLTLGHVAGLTGAFAGTVSLVLARKMARVENNALVQVFYPNLALAVGAIVVLPAVWHPMGPADLGLILLYSALLFLARWMMVLVMRRLRAPVALPLMNIQYVWMVAVGFVFFSEVPQVTDLIGATLIMLAGLIALTQQARLERLALRARGTQAHAIPAE